jgi:arginase
MSETGESKSPRVALLGVPIEIGASQRGTLMGPDALRTAGIGRVLEQLGFDVEDHGNLAVSTVASADGPPPANAKYYDDIKAWIRALSERAFSSPARARFRSSWVAITACRWDR